jgi:NitT/TauT family transport system permease protein
MRGIPAIALFPLILAVLGIVDSSRIAVIIWTAFPPVFISTVYGMQSVDKDVIGAASLDGANRINIAVRVKIPMALCEIMNGIKIAIGTGFISVVTAEMLGANKGIGYMILWSTNAFKYSEVYAYIFVVAVMGFIMSLAMETLTKILEKRIYQ